MQRVQRGAHRGGLRRRGGETRAGDDAAQLQRRLQPARGLDDARSRAVASTRESAVVPPPLHLFLVFARRVVVRFGVAPGEPEAVFVVVPRRARRARTVREVARRARVVIDAVALVFAPLAQRGRGPRVVVVVLVVVVVVVVVVVALEFEI